MAVEIIKSNVGMSWKTVKLEKLCKMNSGGTPSRSIKEYYSGDIPWAKISDIEVAEGGIVYSTEEHITKEGLNAINNRIFEKGTLLLAMYGSVGKVAFTGVDMSTNQAILGIRIIDETVLDYSYLKYWFQTIKSKLLDRAVGGTLQNISLGIVKDLEIPLPPLATQKRIAEILDAADALRRKDQELLKKYDELAQAIFIDMFGDPVKNEKGWDVKSLDKITTKLGDGIHGTPNYSMDGNYYFINGNNLENGTIVVNESTKKVDENEFLKHKKELNENTMLVSINGTIGKVAFYKGENIILGKSACYFNIDKTKVSPIYLYSLIKSNYFVQYAGGNATGSTIKNVSLKTMRGFPVPLPPLSKQMIYDEQITLIWESIKIVNRNEEKPLFNSLINKAFKGELV